MKKLKATKKTAKSTKGINEILIPNDLLAANQKVSDEMNGIIHEYKEQNNTEILTEEDLTNIFGMEALYPDPNMPISKWFDYSVWTVCEWQDYYSDYTLTASSNISVQNEFDENNLENVNQLSENDEFEDAFNDYYSEYWLPDDYPQISEAHFWKQYEKDIEIEMMKELYDLGDADCIDEGDWERSLEEELEHKLSLRTKTVEVNVNDFAVFSHWLYRGMEETTYLLKIHWNTGDRKFLIKVSDEEQSYFYQVILEFDSNNGKSSLYLGSDTWRSSVWDIIDYYLETGNSTDGN